ncbi:hypothetical protein MED121_07805 [Marinomonas sp. MED121]|nr:hypothetical protein MED121_07805 [Marinomonas sp. MED121]
MAYNPLQVNLLSRIEIEPYMKLKLCIARKIRIKFIVLKELENESRWLKPSFI